MADFPTAQYTMELKQLVDAGIDPATLPQPSVNYALIGVGVLLIISLGLILVD